MSDFTSANEGLITIISKKETIITTKIKNNKQQQKHNI
jgi:hypothetical protein